MNAQENISAYSSDSVRIFPTRVFFNMSSLPTFDYDAALAPCIPYESNSLFASSEGYRYTPISSIPTLNMEMTIEELGADGYSVPINIIKWFSERGVVLPNYTEQNHYGPPKHYIAQYTPDLKEGLREDTILYLNQNRLGYEGGRGIIGKWTYSSREFPGDRTCGDELWEMFTHVSEDYYVKRNQGALIRQNAPWMYSLVGDVDMLVDFGCGGQEAVKQQIIPLLDQFKKADKKLTYAPIDNNAAFVTGANDTIFELRPDISVSGVKGDYTKGLSLPSGSKLGLFFGASTNYASFPDGMIDLMDAFRVVLQPGSHIAMTIDTNTDAKSIKKSYSHPLHGQQLTNIIYRFARDLKMAGNYDPDAWEYETQVINYRYEGYPLAEVLHVMRSTKDQFMWIKGSGGSLILKGEGLVADKSYKLPIELIEHLGESRGYQLKGCKYDEQGWMALPVFQLI